MSTEVVKQQTSPSQFNFFDPEAFATMQRVATVFSNSLLVPNMYRTTKDNPKEMAIANCIIALSMANRIGADPLMVMQNMYIVYGQPGWSAKFLTATVNACGKYQSIKYKFKENGTCKGVEYQETIWVSGNKKIETKKVTEDIPNIECIAYTSEIGSDEILESITVSVKMAIEEGWYFKNGSKWKTMPKLMLQYRTVTFWTRAYAPELSMGLKTVDEINDTIDVEYTDVTNSVLSEIKEKGNTELVDFKQEENIENSEKTELKKTDKVSSEVKVPSAEIKSDTSNPAPTLKL